MPAEDTNGKELPEICQVHAASVDRRFAAIESRLDNQDVKIGGMFREASGAHTQASGAREEAAGSRQAVLSLTNTFTAFAQDMIKRWDEREEHCRLVHKAVDAEIDKLAAMDSTLEAKSGLSLAMSDPEKMVERHEALKKEVEKLKEKAREEVAAKREAEVAKRAAAEALKLEEENRAKADAALLETEKARSELEVSKRRETWKAYLGFAVGIVGAVTTALVTLAPYLEKLFSK